MTSEREFIIKSLNILAQILINSLQVFVLELQQFILVLPLKEQPPIVLELLVLVLLMQQVFEIQLL